MTVMEAATAARSFFGFQSSPMRWPIALQAGVAILLPAAIGALIGHPELGLLASSGGFMAAYLPYRTRRERAKWLPMIGAALFIGAVLGVVTANNHFLALWVLCTTTIVVTIVAFAFRIGPPSAFFYVLVMGVSSRMALSTDAGGMGWEGKDILLSIGAGHLATYLVVVCPLPRRLREAFDRAAIAGGTPVTFSLDEQSKLIVLRISLATVVATVVSGPLGIERYYWVLITVVAVLHSGSRAKLSLKRAAHRVLGTVLGIGVFWLLLQWGPGGLWLALILGLLQFGFEVLTIRNYTYALGLVTPLALSIASAGHASAAHELIDVRFIDTLLGAGIALGSVAATVAWQRRPTWARSKEQVE